MMHARYGAAWEGEVLHSMSLGSCSDISTVYAR